MYNRRFHDLYPSPCGFVFQENLCSHIEQSCQYQGGRKAPGHGHKKDERCAQYGSGSVDGKSLIDQFVDVSVGMAVSFLPFHESMY